MFLTKIVHTMQIYVTAAQVIVAVSVAYVWIFRYDVIIKEFKEFGLSDVMRAFVGASKVALATLLMAGIWFPPLVPIPAVLMGLFMLAAQYFHFKMSNPLIKRLPSFVFLLLCAFISLVSFGLISL